LSVLNKLFGNRRRGSLPGADAERALAGIVSHEPHVRHAALVRASGLFEGCFPARDSLGHDRLAAMSAALFSLGERVSKESRSGRLHYALVAGEDGLNLFLVLDRDHPLMVGLHPGASPDAVFDGLRLSAIPLLQLLSITERPI
jgi:predicted regulator of Ras-like GTPase activity (Roadblock/LC7/MglB family)